MDDSDPLAIRYQTVRGLTERVLYAAESISLEFDRWNDAYVRGPSLYFLMVGGVHAGDYADALGANTWPVEECAVVDSDLQTFVQAARTVAFERDGAVLISTDGTIQKQMIRIKSPDAAMLDRTDESIDYADWMGTKHLSAVEISVRPDILAAVTLSEENGRVTAFENGSFEDYQRNALGGKWRSTE